MIQDKSTLTIVYSQVFIKNINKKLSKFIYFVSFLYQPILVAWEFEATDVTNNNNMRVALCLLTKWAHLSFYTPYIKSNTGPCTRHMPCFVWFRLLVVWLWTKKVFQVVKMVSSLEQCVFIVKWYYESYLLKYACNDFVKISKFCISMQSCYAEFLKSIQKRTYARWFITFGTAVYANSEKREAMAKNVMEFPVSPSS